MGMPCARMHRAKASSCVMYADNAPPPPVDEGLPAGDGPPLDGPPLDDVLPPHAAVSSTRPTVMARTPSRRGRVRDCDCDCVLMAASVPADGCGRATRGR